jgi:Fe-S-cluster containining protein
MDILKGEVTVEGKKIKWETTFDKGFRFKCIGKATCCSGRICEVLSRDEERLGKIAGKGKVESFEAPGGETRKILSHSGNGDCAFLEKGRCSIYDKRPAMCRGFPFNVIFVGPDRAFVDLEWQCCALPCLDDPKIGKPPSAEIDEAVKEKYLSLSGHKLKDGRSLLDAWTESFVKMTAIAELMDHKKASEKVVDRIADRMEKASDLLELNMIISTYVTARAEIPGKIRLAHADSIIRNAEKREIMKIEEPMWHNFMANSFYLYAEYLLKTLGGMPVARRSLISGRVYNESISGNDLVFEEDGNKLTVSPMKIERKPFDQAARRLMSRYLKYIWRRAYTQYDLCRLMNFLYAKTGGRQDLVSLGAQLLVTTRVLENMQFHLSVITEKNGHRTITKDDLMEAIDIFDPMIMRMCESSTPFFEGMMDGAAEQEKQEGEKTSDEDEERD